MQQGMPESQLEIDGLERMVICGQGECTHSHPNAPRIAKKENPCQLQLLQHSNLDLLVDGHGAEQRELHRVVRMGDNSS